MNLEPLKQWYCDTCDDVIEKPEDGWVYWSRDRQTNKVFGFHIVHHMAASPRRKGLERGEQLDRSCYPAEMELTAHLDTMLGPRGIADMLSYMDVGAYHDPKGNDLGMVKDVRNWAETFRRLHLPYYEQARGYFAEATSDGDLDGVNEVALYLESTLKGLVERYGSDA